MATAQWKREPVRHGGGFRKVPAKSFIVDRDGRRFEDGRAATGKSQARMHRRRVQAVRRQIKDGTYDVNGHLAAILDEMVNGLIA